jgi:hypothetical protein
VSYAANLESGEPPTAHTEILTGASEARTARIHLHGHGDTRGGGVDGPQAHGAADLESSGARMGGGQDGGSGGRLRPSLHHPFRPDQKPDPVFYLFIFIISTNNIAIGMVRGGRKYAFNPPKIRFLCYNFKS